MKKNKTNSAPVKRKYSKLLIPANTFAETNSNNIEQEVSQLEIEEQEYRNLKKELLEKEKLREKKVGDDVWVFRLAPWGKNEPQLGKIKEIKQMRTSRAHGDTQELYAVVTFSGEWDRGTWHLNSCFFQKELCTK
jgi:hypothetical protein